MSDWIRAKGIKGQLPKENVLVYVFNKKGFIYVDKMVDGKWVLTNNSDDIVHWMDISEEPVTEHFVSVDELHKEIDSRLKMIHDFDIDENLASYIIDMFHGVVEICQWYEVHGIPYNIVKSATKGKDCFKVEKEKIYV